MGNRSDNLSNTRIICIWDSRNWGYNRFALHQFAVLFVFVFFLCLDQDKGIFID